MSRSNCILFAIGLYRRRRQRGEEVYLTVRRSRFGKFPHMLVFRRRKTGSWQAVSYKPVNPQQKKLPPPLFKGAPRFGD